MAVTTARDIVKHALSDLGVTEMNETPSAEDANLAFDKLNLLVDLWSGKNLMHATSVQENFTLVIGTGSYVIGDSQTFDTIKPIDILGSFLRDGTTDYGITIVGKDNYNRESDKTLQGIPSKLFYDKGVSQQSTRTGTIYLHPVPDKAYSLYIDMVQPFTQFTSLDSTVTFPTGYKAALINNLAVELSPAFGAVVSKELAYKAKDSYDTIQNINARNMSGAIKLDIPGQYYNSDIYEGQ